MKSGLTSQCKQKEAKYQEHWLKTNYQLQVNITKRHQRQVKRVRSKKSGLISKKYLKEFVLQM